MLSEGALVMSTNWYNYIWKGKYQIPVWDALNMNAATITIIMKV